MSKVVVYSIIPCPYCERAKALLSQEKVPFEVVLVQRDDEKMRQWLLDKSGMRTFPQIFCDDKLIGGFQELNDLYKKEGGLASLK